MGLLAGEICEVSFQGKNSRINSGKISEKKILGKNSGKRTGKVSYDSVVWCQMLLSQCRNTGKFNGRMVVI